MVICVCLPLIILRAREYAHEMLRYMIRPQKYKKKIADRTILIKNVQIYLLHFLFIGEGNYLYRLLSRSLIFTFGTQPGA